MIDPFSIATLLVGLILVGTGAYWQGSIRGYARGLAQGRSELPVAAVIFEELEDLRYFKAQVLDPTKPVVQHEHIYPREPDYRKLGWLRYRCEIPTCPALKWERREPKPPATVKAKGK